MSKESLDQFMNQVADSEKLQTRIGEGIDSETLIALGAEHGCEFSADDLTAEAELSDAELDGVAGGLAQANQAPNFRIVLGVQSANGDFRPPDHPGGPGRKLVCDGSST
ncbi:MAG TPA: Nif11-like leader peptide family natural product precursor [Pseudomonadales bacterium]|nr:Nif11-like leader peptide family natural product precursor [Pseudomonadales bacterium]